MKRLAVICTHPIQYYAPWFRHLSHRPGIDLRVFYLWDFGVREQRDPGFGQPLQWDLPLLEGYTWEMVPNRSRNPGTHHFRGLDNPELLPRLAHWQPDATLCLGYNYLTFIRLLLRGGKQAGAIFFRGDSHRLLPQVGLKSWAKRQAIAGLFRRFSAFLYVGAANRDYLRLHGARDDQLFFSPHSVDNDRFAGARASAEAEAAAWKRAIGIGPGQRVILFVGKLEEKKRPQDLLAAFAAAQLANTALLFVGAGALDQDLREAAAGVPNVFFAGFQNQTLMPRTYAAADLLVLPSFGGGETWGLCANESMCLGRPAIVSDHVGCARDLILPEQTGWVFPAGDVGQLSALLRRVWADPAKLQATGQAAARHIQNYSYTQATHGVEMALDAICNGFQ